MAPEEHAVGAEITARTTVFNLGRMLQIFLGPIAAGLADVQRRATAHEPAQRQPSVEALQHEWRVAAALAGLL